MKENESQSGLGIAGMILGIIALVFFCIGIGGLLGLIGLILSIVAVNNKKRKQGCAIAGIVLNSIALLLFILIMLVSVNKTYTEETSQKQPATTTTVPAPLTTNAPQLGDNLIDITINNCTVKYLRHELKNDVWGDEYLVVYYEFTNNTNSSTSFGYTISDQAFQNGVKLESSYSRLEAEANDKYTEIKPGVTITVYSLFTLRDKSVVELEVDEWISFDEKAEDNMTLSIE